MKNTQADICFTHDHTLKIKGPLTFDTVPALWKKTLLLLKKYDLDAKKKAQNQKGTVKDSHSQQQPLQLDMSAVTTCDSAALAFLVEITSLLAKQAKLLQMIDFPAELRSLAKVSGMCLQG